MANTVKIGISAQDDASRTLDGIKGKFTGLHESSGWRGVMLGSGSHAGVRAFTAIGAGLGAAFASGLEGATAFEDQLTTINTVARLSEDALASMGDEIQALAREIGKPTEELTAGMYDLVSAGVPAEQAISVLRDSARFATGALGTTGEAVDLVTSAMNAYGLKASDSSRITDIFARAVQDGKVTAADLGASLANIAPIAAAAGVSLEEVSAGYAIMTAKGTPAAQAATQMRAAISALLTPNIALNSIQKETNQNFAEMARERGLAATLEELRKATGGNAEQFAKALGSMEAYQFALASTGDSADEFAAQIEETGQSTGLAAEQYDIAASSSAASGRRFTQTIKTFLQDVGQPFVETLGPWAQSLNALGPAFGGAISGVKILGTVAGGLVGKLFPELAAKLIPEAVVAGAVTGEAFAGAEAGGGFLGTVKTKLSGRLGVLLGAVGVIGVAAMVEELNDPLDDLASQIHESLTPDEGEGMLYGTIFDSIGDAVQRTGHALVTAPWPLGNGAGSKVPEQLEKGLVQPTTSALRDVEELWQENVRKTNDTASAGATLLAGTLEDGRSEVASGAAELFGPLVGELVKAREEAVTAAGQVPGKLAAAFRQGREEWRIAIATLGDDLQDEMSITTERMAVLAQLGGENIAKGLKSADPIVRQQADDTVAILEARLIELDEMAREYGYNTADAFAGGLRSATELVKTAAGVVAGAARGVLAAFSPPGPESPLHDIQKWGFNTIASFADGIASAKGDVAEAAREAVQAAKDAILALTEGSVEVAQGFRDMLFPRDDSLMNQMIGQIDALLDPLTAKATEIGGEAGEALQGAILQDQHILWTDMEGMLSEFVQNIAAGAKDAAGSAFLAVREEIMATTDSVREIGGALLGSVADVIRGRRDSVADAMKQLVEDLKGQTTQDQEIADLSAMLFLRGEMLAQALQSDNSVIRLQAEAAKALAEGLASADPVVRAQAEATIKLIQDRLAFLNGTTNELGYTAGHEYAEGLASAQAEATAAVEAYRASVHEQYDQAILDAESAGTAEGRALATALRAERALALSAAKDIGQGIIDEFKASAQPMVDAFGPVGQGITDHAVGWKRGILDQWREVRDRSDEWGNRWVDALATGVRRAGPNLQAAFREILERIRAMIAAASPPKEGPLRDIDKQGFNIMKALGDGMRGAKNYVTDSAEAALGGIGGLSPAIPGSGSSGFGGPRGTGYTGPTWEKTPNEIHIHINSQYPLSPIDGQRLAQAMAPDITRELQRRGVI